MNIFKFIFLNKINVIILKTLYIQILIFIIKYIKIRNNNLF